MVQSHWFSGTILLSGQKCLSWELIATAAVTHAGDEFDLWDDTGKFASMV